MIRLFVLILPLFATLSLYGMDADKQKDDQEKTTSALATSSVSALCKLFAVDPNICNLPEDIQRMVAARFKALYPRAFGDWTLNCSFRQLKLGQMQNGKPFDTAQKKTAISNNAIADFILIDNGSALITISTTGLLAFWRIPSMKLIKEFQLPSGVTHNDANCLLAANSNETLLAISGKMKVYIYKLPVLTLKCELNVGTQAKKIVFSKKTDQELLIVLSEKNQIWDVGTATCLQSIHTFEDIKSIALSPDQSVVAFISQRSANRAMSLTLYNWQDDPKRFDLSNQFVYNDMIFLDNNHLLISVDSHLVLLRLNANKESLYEGPFINATLLTLEKTIEQIQRNSCFSRRDFNLDYDPSKKWLCCHGKNMTTVIYDLQTGKRIYTLTDPKKNEDFNSPSAEDFKYPFCYQPQYRDDAAVKCLLHPFLPFCLTLRSKRDTDECHTLHVWKVVPIVPSVENALLLIKESLFIILMSILKEKRLPRYISFDETLRNELAAIFRAFPPTQKEFVAAVLFNT